MGLVKSHSYGRAREPRRFLALARELRKTGTMRANSFLPVAAVAAIVVGGPRVAAAEPAIRIYESPTLSEVTEGETTIEANPDDAYATASDYTRWTTIFPDIRKVTVSQQVGVDARVSLDYSDHRNNLHFHNDPRQRRVWFENLHSRADMWADLTFSPGTRPGTTRVHARVYADVHGVAGVFVSEGKLRRARTERIQGDLTQLRTYFAAQAMQTRTAGNP